MGPGKRGAPPTASVRQPAESARARAAGALRRFWSGTTLYTRTLVWVTAAIAVALVLATLGEAWMAHGLDEQVRQARAQTALLRRDEDATRRRIARARAPATIEDEARAQGYVRPGERPMVVVAAPSPAPAPTASATAAGATAAAPGAGSVPWWLVDLGG